MSKITPCLWFDTEGEEAANFYVSIFKNSRILEVNHYGEAGPRSEGAVMTVAFELDGLKFTALNGGPEFTFNESVSFEIACADQAEVDHYWDRLLEGGGQPSQCGWLKDRYGVSWQVVPTALYELVGGPDPKKAQAAMKAMLGMVKLDVAALQKAYDEG
jgi:predicted 3-demethylubiquinone-9 3-methyltransferase (glyoxalase superfamily)